MMSFRNKLGESINRLANQDKPDCSKSNINSFADFIELLALFSGTDGVTYGDLQDRFYGEPDEYNTSEDNDNNESFLDEIFTLIDERNALYKESYPFEKNKDDVIVLKKELFSCQKLYIFLLLSSSLDIFSSFNTELTTDFETLCCEAMKLYIPNAIVKPFGKNTEYKGTAKEKIKKLAKDIGLATDDYEMQQIGERNHQERGLDIVSWLPFTDNCQNLVVFLGQCACGKQYESKQHDTRRFENYYKFYKTKPQHTLFIPYSLINPKERKFYHSDCVEKDYLIFERMRIVGLLKNNEEVFNRLESKELIDECIKYTPTFF